jgi:hypothetical protein
MKQVNTNCICPECSGSLLVYGPMFLYFPNSSPFLNQNSVIICEDKRFQKCNINVIWISIHSIVPEYYFRHGIYRYVRPWQVKERILHISLPFPLCHWSTDPVLSHRWFNHSVPGYQLHNIFLDFVWLCVFLLD